MKRSTRTPLTICRASTFDAAKLKRIGPPPARAYALAISSSASLRLTAADTVTGSGRAGPCAARSPAIAKATNRTSIYTIYCGFMLIF
jgi:hypothetical protein